MATKELKKEEIQKFDLRVIEQRLRRGEIDRKEYEAFLKKLPNDEGGADYIEVYDEPPPEEPTPHADELTFTSA